MHTWSTAVCCINLCLQEAYWKKNGFEKNRLSITLAEIHSGCYSDSRLFWFVMFTL